MHETYIGFGMLCSSSVVVLFALAVAESYGLVVNNGSVALSAGSSDADFPGPWVSDLFYRALANFTVRNVGSAVCREQVEMYDKHLRNHTYWAVRMSESWSRYPNGILAGNRYHLGVYDECVGVQYPIQGQYCLSEIKLMSSEKDYSYNRTDDPGKFDHSWQTLLGWLDYSDQVQRNTLNLGICIPNSCSAMDLQTSLQKELDYVFHPEKIKSTVKVDSIMCTVYGDMYPYNTGYNITSAFFAVLVLVCCGVTLHHYKTLSSQHNKNKSSNISDFLFNTFSFIESSKELLKFDKDNELNMVNGFKVLVMIFILFGHRFMYLAGNPMVYPENYENIYIDGPDILLTSMNLVDPFFFMSGFLMYMMIIPVYKKPGHFLVKFLSPIIYRIARLLPAYCAMMAITAHIVPHLGDGPFWPQKTWEEAERCKTYWWTNILFISNFIDINHQCLIVSWYVSCDVQFYIAGATIVYIYMKNRKCGIGLLTVMICTSLMVPFMYTFLTQGDGILKVNLPFLEDPRSSVTFSDSYRPSYMRATPFFTGLALAFVVEKLKENKVKFSQMTVYGGTFLVTVITVWTQFYGAIFYERHRPYYPLEQALYSTYSHCTWTILSSWICLCHFTTGYGLLTKVVSNRVFVPLGRLSYSVFLVNLIVMLMSQSSQRLPVYPSTKSLLDAWIYDTFKSYLMGLALYLVVEAPFGNMVKQLFGRGKKKTIPNTNGMPNEKHTCVKTSTKELSNL